MRLAKLGVSLSSAAILAGLALAPSAHADDEWRYSLTPYLWIAGLDGKFAVSPALPTVGVQQDFGDILDTTQFAFMGKAEAWRGPLHIFGELSYADIGGASVLDNPDFTAASVSTETFLGTGAVGYRVFDQPGQFVDVIGGLRYTFTKLDIALNRTDGTTATGGEDENWGDLFIGVRGAVEVAPNWSLSGYGDLGAGYSDYTWQAYAGANYRFNNGVQVFGGYRAYKDKYDNDGYIYNVTQKGPILGATFDF